MICVPSDKENLSTLTLIPKYLSASRMQATALITRVSDVARLLFLYVCLYYLIFKNSIIGVIFWKKSVGGLLSFKKYGVFVIKICDRFQLTNMNRWFFLLTKAIEDTNGKIECKFQLTESYWMTAEAY